MKRRIVIGLIVLLIIPLGLTSCGLGDGARGGAKVNEGVMGEAFAIEDSVHDLIQIENLGVENDNAIPNLWGIVLGETSMKNAKIILSEISEDIEGPFFEDEYVFYRVNFYDSFYGEDFYFIFYCNQYYIIQEIKLPNLFMSIIPFTFENSKHVSVDEMIVYYGIPNKITVEQSQFIFGLYVTFHYDYFTYSFFTIESKPNENDIFRACFIDNPYILISNRKEPFLRGPYFTSVDEAIQIDEIDTYSIKGFSETIVENPNYCFELNYKELFELYIEKSK